MDEYSHLDKGWYTQEEAWTELGIGKTTWYTLKKKHEIKTHEAEGIKIQRVSREQLIKLHKMLFKKLSAPPSEPAQLKAEREKKGKK